MVRIGIHSYRLNEPTNDFFKSFMTYVIILFTLAFYVTSSAWYIATKTNEFGEILDPSFALIGGSQLAGMYICIGLKMRKVKAIQLVLQGIVDEGMCL